MAAIAIAFTQQTGAQASWNLVFSQFTSQDYPRQWLPEAKFDRSVTGAVVLDGPQYRQKYLWTIDCIVTKTEAEQLHALYEAWDSDRAQGYSVAVGIADNTFAGTVNSSAVFSSPPSFTFLHGNTIVNFALTEV